MNSEVKLAFQISLPKCGTHLLSKCISKIHPSKKVITTTIHNPIKYYDIPMTDLDKLSKLTNKHYILSHLMYKKEYDDFLATRHRVASFLIYRDPRDQVISFAYFMKSRPKAWPKASKMNMDDLIYDLIAIGSVYNDHPPVKNVYDLYQRYLPWVKCDYICHIRFEHLIGRNGGGDDDIQYQEIKKIGKHMNVTLDEKKIRQIGGSLFGNSVTFRSGQIGKWKTHFNEKHKKAFKSFAGQLLVDLGYEKDLNW